MGAKEAIFRKDHAPNNKLYLSLLCLSVIILLFLFLIYQNSVWYIIASGIGSGGVASVLVAWFVDMSNCRTLNIRDAKIRFFFFDDLFFSIGRLLEIPSIYSNEEEQNKRKWFEWFDAMMKSDVELMEDDVKFIIDTIESVEEEIKKVMDRRLEIMVEGILAQTELDNLSAIKGELVSYKLMLKTKGWSEKLPFLTTNEIKEKIEKTKLLCFLNHEDYLRNKTIDYHDKFIHYFTNE